MTGRVYPEMDGLANLERELSAAAAKSRRNRVSRMTKVIHEHSGDMYNGFMSYTLHRGGAL
jgi:hypothetical protein